MTDASGERGPIPEGVRCKLAALEAAARSLRESGSPDGEVRREIMAVRKKYKLFDQPTSDMSDW